MPYDAEVEYLESTGTQYITLPVSVAAGDFFGVGGEMVADNYTGRKNLVTSNGRNQCNLLKYGNTSTQMKYLSTVGGTTTEINLPLNEVSSWEISTEGVTVNDVFTELSRPLTTAFTTVTLFVNNGSPSKICSFYIKHGPLGKIYDLIAVRVGTTGYMYDKVSGALYGNEGTEAFIVGSDKNS